MTVTIIIMVNIHPNNVIMNSFIFRKTHRLSMSSFEMRSNVQIPPFNPPGMLFSNTMLVGGNQFGRALPIIRIIIANGKDGKLMYKLCTRLICALSGVMRYNRSTAPFKGIPRPALATYFFVPVSSYSCYTSI